MGFESAKRRGRYWEDCKQLHSLINNYNFNTTGKYERDFENGLASTLGTMKNSFDSSVITQVDRSTTVQSVYCFGKNHRPDMTLGTNGIAIELKLVTYDGLKNAIGQGFLYRLRYKFVFLILVISKEKSSIYYDLDSNQERDLHDTLRYLADTMNIFTYVVPAFSTTPGVKKCISFFINDPTG